MLEYKNASEEFAPQITETGAGDDCFGISEILSERGGGFLPDCTVKMQSEKTSGTEI